MLLGVNIDHIAVLREARKMNDPSPIDAIGICKLSGANQITIHLREDRRHIQDIDATKIISSSPLPVNLECAKSEDIISIVSVLKPHRATIVPEKREEVTTEGGLLVDENDTVLKNAIVNLQSQEIEVSLFIDPSKDAINSAISLGVEWIEFHTGEYANIYAMLYGNLSSSHHTIPELKLPRKELIQKLSDEIENLENLSKYASDMGLRVAAGHGLNYQNVSNIAKIEDIEELNIGQSIIARSIFTGLEKAIVDMKSLI